MEIKTSYEGNFTELDKKQYHMYAQKAKILHMWKKIY